jgi:hypothetical protein
MLKRHACAVLCALLLAAPAGGQTVRGEVRDAASGRPLAGARLMLINVEGIALDSTRVDRTGAYALTGRVPGEHMLWVQLDGWASTTSESFELVRNATTEFTFRPQLVASAALREMSDVLASDERLRQELPEMCGEPFRAWEAGLLVGSVRVRATRQTLAGARVTVLAPDGAATRATVSSDKGVYLLCNVPVGTAIRVVVETANGQREETDVEIRAGTASWYDLEVGPRRTAPR